MLNIQCFLKILNIDMYISILSYFFNYFTYNSGQNFIAIFLNCKNFLFLLCSFKLHSLRLFFKCNKSSTSIFHFCLRKQVDISCHRATKSQTYARHDQIGPQNHNRSRQMKREQAVCAKYKRHRVEIYGIHRVTSKHSSVTIGQ